MLYLSDAPLTPIAKYLDEISPVTYHRHPFEAPIYPTLIDIDLTGSPGIGVRTVLCLRLSLICHHFFHLLVYIIYTTCISLLSKFNPRLP